MVILIHQLLIIVSDIEMVYNLKKQAADSYTYCIWNYSSIRTLDLGQQLQIFPSTRPTNYRILTMLKTVLLIDEIVLEIIINFISALNQVNF